MGSCKFDHKEFDELKERLEQLANGKETEKFYEDCAKELAARLLALVIPDTPVGVYPQESGISGGSLRRGWTDNKDVDPDVYVQGVKVEKSGKTYTITIVNNVEYAPYVEYGHRQTPGRYVPAIGKRLKESFVPGKHMLQKSEQKLQSIAPSVLKKKTDKFLKEAFNG